MKNELKVLVVGGGMYVIGRGTADYGTIVPALFEGMHRGFVQSIAIATTNHKSANFAAKRSEELAQKMGLQCKVDYFPKQGVQSEAFLDAVDSFKPDAVIVSVPDHLHAEVTLPLLKRGLHCLLVKPFAPTLAEAQLMAKTAETHNVVAEVEFHKRLDESNRMLRDAVQSGRLGEPLYAVIEYSQQKRIPTEIFRGWAEKSNIFQYLGVHYVDLLQFATDYLPKRVTAWGQKVHLKELGIDTWDAMQVVIEWDNRKGGCFVSTHITNWIDPNESSAMSDQKINLVGTKGRFQADQKNRGVQIVTDGVGVKDENPYFSRAFGGYDNQRLSYLGYGIGSINQFLTDVVSFRKGELSMEEIQKTRPSFKTCVVSSAVVEAANQSILTNQPVEVSL